MWKLLITIIASDGRMTTNIAEFDSMDEADKAFVILANRKHTVLVITIIKLW